MRSNGRFDVVLAEVAGPIQPRPGRHGRPLQAPDVRRRQHRHARRGRHHAPAHRPQGHDERAVPEGPRGQDATAACAAASSSASPAAASATATASSRRRNGEPMTTGEREIVPAEADVIRRIFRDYAAGVSPKAIAKRLNRGGRAGPGRRVLESEHDPRQRQRAAPACSTTSCTSAAWSGTGCAT